MRPLGESQVTRLQLPALVRSIVPGSGERPPRKAPPCQNSVSVPARRGDLRITTIIFTLLPAPGRAELC